MSSSSPTKSILRTSKTSESPKTSEKRKGVLFRNPMEDVREYIKDPNSDDDEIASPPKKSVKGKPKIAPPESDSDEEEIAPPPKRKTAEKKRSFTVDSDDERVSDSDEEEIAPPPKSKKETKTRSNYKGKGFSYGTLYDDRDI